jgi:hypothetical protein
MPKRQLSMRGLEGQMPEFPDKDADKLYWKRQLIDSQTDVVDPYTMSRQPWHLIDAEQREKTVELLLEDSRTACTFVESRFQVVGAVEATDRCTGSI